MSNIITVAKQQPTIVTVPAKAVKQDLKTETNTIVYIPLASTLTPGVVQIGDGLNIDSNGILSLDKDEITILQIAKNGEIINPNENKIVNIVLNKYDVGLDNVDNTSDMNKPVSIYQQAALDGKLDIFAGPDKAGQMLYVDEQGFIKYRQIIHQFVTKNDGQIISKDTLSYNYSSLFLVNTRDGNEVNIDGSEDLKSAFKNVSYNPTNGVLSFTKLNDETLNVDLPLELIIQSGYYNTETQELVLVLASGGEIKIPVAELVNIYHGDDETISLIEKDNKLIFTVKDSGITTDKIANYTITDDKIVSVSGSKINGSVGESVKASQDSNGNNIANTYRKITESYSKSEVTNLLKDKADVSQLPVIQILGGI